jgi:hypothetical protein
LILISFFFKYFLIFIWYFFKGFFLNAFYLKKIIIIIFSFVIYVLLFLFGKIPFFNNFFYFTLLYSYILAFATESYFLQLLNAITLGFKNQFNFCIIVIKLFFYCVFSGLIFLFYLVFSRRVKSIYALLKLDFLAWKYIFLYFLLYKVELIVKILRVQLNRSFFLKIYLFFFRRSLQLRSFYFRNLDKLKKWYNKLPFDIPYW